MADAMPETAIESPAEDAERGGAKQTATLALVAVGGLLVALAQTLLVPVLP